MGAQPLTVAMFSAIGEADLDPHQPWSVMVTTLLWVSSQALVLPAPGPGYCLPSRSRAVQGLRWDALTLGGGEALALRIVCRVVGLWRVAGDGSGRP